MKTQDILELDYRKEENKNIIQKVLRKIKPLSKYSDEEIIPFEKLEKLILKISQKYEYSPEFHISSYTHIYYGFIKNMSNDRIIYEKVYGICIYELYAKMAIKMYSDIKQNKVKIREGN